LISEPTVPWTVVMTTVIACASLAANPENGAWPWAFTVVMLAGAFQILFRTAEAGSYITMMPYTVISAHCPVGIIPIIRSDRPSWARPFPRRCVGTLRADP